MHSKRLENFKWPEQLQKHHLENTKMYPSRESVLKYIPKNSSYLEIGVLAGDYTQEVINEIKPRDIVLIDTFDCDDSVFTQKLPRFTAQSHLQFVTDRFSSKADIKIIKGLSFDTLPTLERTFDYIYIDADHTYEAVLSDINQSVKLLRPGGLIGLNDYIMWDYLVDFQYGVVQAVNEFLNKNLNWVVKYFALSPSMFCDIYLELICEK